MGLFSFLKEAGKKIFKSSDEAKKENPAVTNDAIREQQVTALRNYVRGKGLNVQNLDVRFDASDNEVVLTGEAASLADWEKAALMTGNVAGVFKVDNQMTIASAPAASVPSAQWSQTYEVKKGDTLWAIAEHYYGNGAKYTEIVEANQPMIKDADEIYPGQTLRIPSKTA